MWRIKIIDCFNMIVVGFGRYGGIFVLDLFCRLFYLVFINMGLYFMSIYYLED